MAPSHNATRQASGRRGFPWRAAGLVLVIAFALTGIGLLGMAVAAPEPVTPPQPAPEAAPFWPAPDPASSAPATPDPAGASASPEGAGSDLPDGAVEPVGMERSVPTRVRIPRIGVDAEIMTVGLESNGRMEVPPLDSAHLAGWYRHGPSPGEVGNSVIVGHVDSRETGPAVFFELGALVAGDTVEVTRQDGSVATFIVEGTARYPKQDFPTDLVYGPADQAQLRVITCGGEFDAAAGDYLDNVIVFATLAE